VITPFSGMQNYQKVFKLFRTNDWNVSAKKKQIRRTRAGLKPMQLHWAPRLWGSRASGGPAPLGAPRLWGPRASGGLAPWYLGRLFIILPDTPYAREFSKNGLQISLLANKESRLNQRRSSSDRRTLSNVLSSHATALYLFFTMLHPDGWNFVVTSAS